MLRLGLQLTLRSGREAMVRLLITAAAVAVGVALLLGVLAEFHAFQASGNRACWSCTQGKSVPAALPTHGELWNNSVDFYQGQTINRLDVAALGQNAPVPPGITQLPPAGDYYASPALAALIKSAPADQLGDRFPGTMIGTIGQAGLSGPGDLAIYLGHTAAQVNAIPGTEWVTSIDHAPGQEVFSPFFRYAFGVGVLAVVFPMLVLISTATRLAANRREERFAALRLVGGTPADIRTLASVEAMLSAFLGAVLGTAIFLLVRPALASVALVGTRYFESELTPTVTGYIAMLVGVPIAAALAALVSLRRVQISPLGVSRRATPAPPGYWRLAVLVIGLGECAPGLTDVQTVDDSLFDDNPTYQTKPFVSPTDSGYPGDPTKLGLQTVLVKVNRPATLERVRTYLAVNAPPRVGGGYGASPTPPRTFGETLQIRIARATTFERIMYAAIALTLIVAGCSLAVTVGGGLVDRRRPFTLLRVSGTPTGVLSRVVLLEAAVPLLAATVIAAAIAYGTSVLAFVRLAPAGTAIPQLGHDYYAIMGVGLLVAFGVITVTLPLLRRMTAPATVRFE